MGKENLSEMYQHTCEYHLKSRESLWNRRLDGVMGGGGGRIWAGAELHLGTPAQGEHVGPRKNWGWPHGAWGVRRAEGLQKEVREAFERTRAAVQPANLSQIKIFFFIPS